MWKRVIDMFSVEQISSSTSKPSALDGKQCGQSALFQLAEVQYSTPDLTAKTLSLSFSSGQRVIPYQSKGGGRSQVFSYHTNGGIPLYQDYF